MIAGERLKNSEFLRNFVSALLDRIDRLGALPKSFSVKMAECNDADSVKLFFGHDCVSVEKGSAVKLNLAKYIAKLPDAIAGLYKLLNRCRRDIPSEKAGIRQRLECIIADCLRQGADLAMQQWLRSESARIARGNGELWQMCVEKGVEKGCVSVDRLLAALSRGFKILRESDSPLRLSHFGLSVTGDTKSCRVGTPLLKKFAEILCDYDPEISEELRFLDFSSSVARQRAALDMTRLVLDGAATQLLVFGQMIFSKRGQRFTYVADHLKLGEPVILSWAQLENAALEQVPATIVTVENETSFYDLIADCNGEKTAVICTMGQGNRLLVKLLRDSARLAKSFYHSGDLDRSGVLILESLRRRTGIDIRPLNMEPAVLKRLAASALPLPQVEKRM
ncbi:MAG: DUF2399 domain-containing protein, partial [Erysipelotrichia bacterium]|nr:DUF2399 domain-containing protein [Erysipelotrichia bacterium]